MSTATQTGATLFYSDTLMQDLEFSIPVCIEKGSINAVAPFQAPLGSEGNEGEALAVVLQPGDRPRIYNIGRSTSSVTGWDAYEVFKSLPLSAVAKGVSVALEHKANDQGCIVYAFIETSRGLYASSSARKVDGERQWGEPVLVLDSTRDGDWSDPALTDYGYATHPKVAYRVEGTEPQDFLAYCTAREKASDRMDQRLLLLRGKGDGQIDRRYVYLNSFTDLSVSAPNNVTIAACSDNLWMIFMVDGGRLQSYSLLFDVDGVPKIYEGKKSVDLHVQSIVHSFNSGPQAISVIYTRNDGENELASCPYEYGAETHGGSYKEPVNLGVENGIHVTAQLTGDVAGHTVFTLRNDWTVLVNRRLVAKPGHEAPQEWTPPLPLFADVFGCAAPSFGVKSSTLFSWGGAGAYLRVSVQDPVTHSWRTSYVRKPPPKENAIPHEVTRYQVEVQFLDDGGQPMPEHRFHITLAAGFSSSEILHAGKVRSVHHRAEDLAAARDETAISSDANGKIVFSVLEEGLAVPSFEFYDLSRDGKPHLVGKVNPARNIEYYLSGRLDNFNATNPRGPLPRFDAEGKAILQAKFVDLNNVEHALVVATDESPKLAKVVAASCQSLVTMTGEDLPDPPSFTAHFSSPTRSEGNPQFLQMSSSPAYRESLLTGVGVFEWLSETAGDILRGIETGALRILEIACDAVNRTIQFTLDTAERLVTLTVDTYEKVAQAVSGLFNHIGAVVEDVVLWLREIFNFRAIWNTSKALAEMNRVGSDLTSQVLANTEEGITAWFADQKESIRANMTSVRKGLAGVTFSTDNAGERENLALAEIDGGSVSSNWLWNKLESVADTPTLAPVKLSKEQETALAGLASAAASSEEGMLARGDLFTASLHKRLGQGNEFTSIALVELVGLLEDFLVEVVDAGSAVAQTLLKFVRSILQKIQEIMDAPLALGPFDGVWKWVAAQSGEPKAELTAGRLAMLLLAFPATIAYKLIVGASSEPFPGGHFVLPSASHQAPQPRPELGIIAGILQVTHAVPVGFYDLWSGPRHSGMIVTATQWMSASSIFLLRWYADGGNEQLPENPTFSDWLTLFEQANGAICAAVCVAKELTSGLADTVARVSQSILGAMRLIGELISASSQQGQARILAIANCIIAIPDTCGFFCIDAVKAKTAGWSLIIKQIVNFVCYIMGGITVIGIYGRRLNPATSLREA